MITHDIGYIVHSLVAILAIFGLLFLALVVYKKTMNFPLNMKYKDYLKVENLIKLAPTKTVYILKAGTERFLVAGDAASTTMLAKLDDNNIPPEIEYEDETIQQTSCSSGILKQIMDKINRG